MMLWEMEDIVKIIIDEEYDTESIEQDYDDLEKNTNIRRYIKDNKQYRIVRNCILNKKMHSYTFSQGFRFRHRETKYITLKEEILNNTICQLSVYQFKVLLHKATKYMQSVKVKQMNPKWPYDQSRSDGTSVSELLSLIIYCCCTDLCTAFRATYRRNKWNETIESVKDRHSEFSNMAKLHIN